MAKKLETLNVEGMSCSHCENSVKKSVGALDGVSSVAVDLAGKKVSVEFDPEKVSMEKIKETIDDQGFVVKQ
ncbi:MAG: copper chaperone CopZ [Bacillota bacterium]|nr:copper chaperone CopZ [Bacillota bacterium]